MTLPSFIDAVLKKTSLAVQNKVPEKESLKGVDIYLNVNLDALDPDAGKEVIAQVQKSVKSTDSLTSINSAVANRASMLVETDGTDFIFTISEDQDPQTNVSKPQASNYSNTTFWT